MLQQFTTVIFGTHKRVSKSISNTRLNSVQISPEKQLENMFSNILIDFEQFLATSIVVIFIKVVAKHVRVVHEVLPIWERFINLQSSCKNNWCINVRF